MINYTGEGPGGVCDEHKYCCCGGEADCYCVCKCHRNGTTAVSLPTGTSLLSAYDVMVIPVPTLCPGLRSVQQSGSGFGVASRQTHHGICHWCWLSGVRVASWLDFSPHQMAKAFKCDDDTDSQRNSSALQLSCVAMRTLHNFAVTCAPPSSVTSCQSQPTASLDSGSYVHPEP